MSLSGHKPTFDGVAIRCTGADIFKFRGRYISIIAKVDTDGFDADTNTVKAECAIGGEKIIIHHFTGRENITPVLEVVCYVDNVNGSLWYEHHGALDDEFDIKSFALLIPHMHKHSAIFGF